MLTPDDEAEEGSVRGRGTHCQHDHVGATCKNSTNSLKVEKRMKRIKKNSLKPVLQRPLPYKQGGICQRPPKFHPKMGFGESCRPESEHTWKMAALTLMKATEARVI